MDNDSEAVKTVGQDAEKILKLQEKLTSIQNQIHYWTAKSKVFEQRGGCNVDAFVRAPLTPSKRPTKSRSLMARQDWATLNFTQQYEILHNVARDHSRVTLNFGALAMAIKASQSSEALRKALDPESNGDKEEIDPDERKYLFELLEEEAELSEAILKAEDEQLDKKLKLLH